MLGVLLSLLCLNGCHSLSEQNPVTEAAQGEVTEESEETGQEEQEARALRRDAAQQEARKKSDTGAARSGQKKKGETEKGQPREKSVPEGSEKAVDATQEERQSGRFRIVNAALLAEDYDEVLPYSAELRFEEAGLESMELWQLRRAINEIYARHGRQFRNEGQRRYFESRSWYQGNVPVEQFQDSVLNSIEQENLKKLQRVLDRRVGGRSIPETESAAIHFLNEGGVNGFLWARFSSVEGYPFSIAEIVYQMEDESVPWEKVFAAVEAEDGRLATDVSYVTTKKLDALLKRVTGFGISEKRWTWDAGYLPALDVYYMVHGDTNHVVFIGELIEMDGEEVQILCYPLYTYEETPFVVTLLRNEKDFRFVSIADVVDDPGSHAETGG